MTTFVSAAYQVHMPLIWIKHWHNHTFDIIFENPLRIIDFVNVSSLYISQQVHCLKTSQGINKAGCYTMLRTSSKHKKITNVQIDETENSL